jgi:hypothetical protein
VINHAHHWAIVFRAMRIAVEQRNEALAEGIGRMVATREGATRYEEARAWTEAQCYRLTGYEQDLDGKWVLDPSRVPPTKRRRKAGGS